ncbi:MAG: LysE family translocator [Candidatus Taylorbacteria bacterium]|nr:LysE family translocator [Candidatus Taylorbacteria bacterium]
MNDISLFSQFWNIAVLHIGVVMWPGPNLTLVAKNSVTLQLRFALYCTLGIAIGTIAHVSLALVGVSGIVAASPVMYRVLQVIGAGYLIYVGTKAIRAMPYRLEEEVGAAKQTRTAHGAFREGFTNQMTNPKSYFFFFTLFTQVVGETPVGIKVLYGLWMATITFLWFAFVTVTLSNPLVKKRFSASIHYVARAAGVFLIGFGIWILRSAFR